VAVKPSDRLSASQADNQVWITTMPAQTKPWSKGPPEDCHRRFDLTIPVITSLYEHSNISNELTKNASGKFISNL
jgi:hypothetical protein